MAKKRHTAKRRHVTRRRRVGAIPGAIEETGFAIVGAIAGRTVYNMLTKVNAATGKAMLDAKIAAGIITAGGIAIGKFVKGNVGQGIGIGMSAAGGLQLAQSLGVLNGIDNTLNTQPMVAGYLSNGSSQGGNNLVAGMRSEPGMGMVGAIVDEC